jgi:hypothetical protein
MKISSCSRQRLLCWTHRFHISHASNSIHRPSARIPEASGGEPRDLHKQMQIIISDITLIEDYANRLTDDPVPQQMINMKIQKLQDIECRYKTVRNLQSTAIYNKEARVQVEETNLQLAHRLEKTFEKLFAKLDSNATLTSTQVESHHVGNTLDTPSNPEHHSVLNAKHSTQVSQSSLSLKSTTMNFAEQSGKLNKLSSNKTKNGCLMQTKSLDWSMSSVR